MRLSELKAFIERYQHELSIGSFVVGFTIDTIILKRIDLFISNALLITYLSVVVVVMLLLHYWASRPPRIELVKRISLWVPFAAQFAFGGMFSGFLIFYSQAGSVIASWPFLLLIVALIIGNEFLRTYQSRLTYQSLLLFFCLFSFSIYALPIFLGRMGDTVFEYSGILALITFLCFMALLWFVDRRRVRASLGNISIGVLGVYGLITTLYFSNVLPPIPLALKDIGVYHSVTRTGEAYAVLAEEVSWHARLTGLTVSVVRGSPVYAFSSVFAPTKLTTSVVHRWQHFDEGSGAWRTVSTIPFGILGGRDGGYRGWSTVTPAAAGTWRVRVETTRGQLIGQEEFTLRFVDVRPSLTEEILE